MFENIITKEKCYICGREYEREIPYGEPDPPIFHSSFCGGKFQLHGAVWERCVPLDICPRCYAEIEALLERLIKCKNVKEKIV